MCQVAVKIPDAVLYDTKMDTEEANVFARKAVALEYYVRCGVSLGYCAQIAGMEKEDFMKYLGQNGVSIFHFDNKKEFTDEIANA
jgi:predicted HTH domain antitoxin